MHMSSVLYWLPPFRNILLISITLRISLILYSEWHDAHSIVKYTDVDYRVFSDAARFILHPELDNIAKGPFGQWLGVGDPYKRETYRYTPLLALLLAPNEWLHPSFGKYLFAACDIINGILIYNLLVSVVLTVPISTRRQHNTPPERRLSFNDGSITKRATLLASLHLLNPMVFAISTRGSSESVLSLFVLLTTWCALNERWDGAAIFLGLSTHWKIYPVIYGVGCLGAVGRGRGGEYGYRGWRAFLRSIINWHTARFGILSASTFIFLSMLCYLVWGYPFLYESYLYHLHRLDHRHNFSPYFYLIYLTYPSLHPPQHPVILPWWRTALKSPLTSFVPQMSLALSTGLLFGRRKEHLVFTWFVQTVTFVLFNKVCTSQYFLWYLVFLPLILSRLSISPRYTVAYLTVWVGTQVLWLNEAYKLEFLGQNVFYGIWVRSLVYVIGNGWVLGGIIDGYARQQGL